MAQILEVKTEYRVNPVGIETQSPRFSWRYKTEKGLIQTSYRVLVASSVEVLNSGVADKWDSGIVQSRTSVNVEYKGESLRSCERCFVKVIVDTTVGKAESDIYTFEMGLFEKDWALSWRSMPLTACGAAIMFRRNVTIEFKEIDYARAYVCGIGYHEFYINGVKLGKGVMNPVISDYEKRVYYNIYDITDHLKRENGIGVLAGNGWFGMPQIAVDLYIKYADGTERFIAAKQYERSWKARKSMIISNGIFDGEVYDARIEDELAGWCEYGTQFTLNNGWYFAVPKLTNPNVRIKAQQIPEIMVQGAKDFVDSYKLKSGNTVLDFGETLTGWCVLEVSGARGASVTMKFTEKVDANGEPDRESLRNALNEDKYILSGKGLETYRPRFSFRGFRYVEVITEGDVEIKKIFAEKLRTNTDEAGAFTCSDTLLNRLHEMAARTEACNHHGILSDCPQRDERMGWLNDLSSRLYQTVNNFGMELFFDKISDDIADTINEKGAIKDTAPYYLGNEVADPVSVAYLLIGKFAYERYGDKRIIEKNYDNYVKWVDFLTSNTKDGILSLGLYGDWVPSISVVPFESRRFNKGLPIPVISTAYLFWHYRLMAFFGELLGKAEDAKKYADLAECTRRAINDNYYDGAKNAYCADVQAMNSIALSLGIADEDTKDGLLEAIVQDISDRNWHMTCGNQSYRHLFGVLADNDRNDVIMKMLHNREYPGYAFMLDCGATTVWERWENEISDVEENMHSYCHPMFGSYDYWFYQYLGGIKVKEGEEGMYSFIIEPVNIPEIQNAECSLATLHGKIAVSYTRSNGKTVYGVTVPPNTTAEFRVKGKLHSDGCVSEDVLTLLSGEYTVVCE